MYAKQSTTAELPDVLFVVDDQYCFRHVEDVALRDDDLVVRRVS